MIFEISGATYKKERKFKHTGMWNMYVFIENLFDNYNTCYFCMYCSNNSLPETAHSPNIDTLNCSCIEPTELITVSTYITPSSIVVLTRVRLSPC